MSRYSSILFIGLGGAGQRHLRYFHNTFPNARLSCFRSRKTTPTLNPDFTVKAGVSVEDEYNLSVFSDYETALANSPDLVVISTPTSFHASQICKALDAGCDVFCEKPGLADSEGFAQIKESLEKSTGNLHLGFQRFHHPVSAAFKNFVGDKKNGEIRAIECKVCSFFPDWHKYEDYRTLYAGKKSLGGGVIRTECHELALLISVFGEFEGLELEQYRDTKFEVDVETLALLTGTFKEIPTIIEMNFLASESRRVITVKTETEDRRFDFDSNQVLTNVNGENFSPLTELQVQDQFQAQLNEVFVQQGFEKEKTLQLLKHLAGVFEKSSSSVVTDAA